MAEKFLDKLKFFMGLDDYEEEEQDIVEEKEVKDEAFTSYSIPAKNKVVNIHSNNNMKVVIFQPKEFNETAEIVDNLKNRKPVIINLEEIDADLARKIFDFCSGALYALDGQIQKVSKGIFILAPNNVDVSGKVNEVEDESKLYKWDK